MHKQMHENEDVFVKQAQGFSPRLFYFALWRDYTINQILYTYKILYSKQNLKNNVKILTYRIKFSQYEFWTKNYTIQLSKQGRRK